MLFLQTAAFDSAAVGGILAGLLLAGAVFMFIFFLLMVGVYIYSSLAFMAVARKAKQTSPGLAWIPGVGPTIIAFRAAKMHWWPWILLAGFIIPVVGFIAGIVFIVFSVIWQWKMFEAVKRPGYWALLSLIPVVNFVLIGIAAWSKD